MNKLLGFFSLLIYLIIFGSTINAALTDVHLEYFKIDNAETIDSIYYGQELDLDIMIKNNSIESSNRIPDVIITATYDDGNIITLREIKTNDSLPSLRSRVISYDYTNQLEIPNCVNLCATLINNTPNPEKICYRIKVIDPFEYSNNSKFDFKNNKLLLKSDISNIAKYSKTVNMQIDYYLPSGKKTIIKEIQLNKLAITSFNEEKKLQELLERDSLENNQIKVCQKLIYDFKTNHTIDSNCVNINIKNAMPYVNKIALWPDIIYDDSKIKCTPEFYFGNLSRDDLNITYYWELNNTRFANLNDNFDCSSKKCKSGDKIKCVVRLELKGTDYFNESNKNNTIQNYFDLQNKLADNNKIIITKNDNIKNNNPIITSPDINTNNILPDQNITVDNTITDTENDLSIFQKLWRWIVDLFS